MKTTTEPITPAIARAWMLRNRGNRKLRPSKVEVFRKAFLRGEYRLTHQGVAFDEEGYLFDGQHRLMAISQMPDGWQSVIQVSREMVREETFLVVDTLHTNRTTADVLHLPPGLAQCANFLARLSAFSDATPAYTEPFALWVQPEYEELVGHCNTTARMWSSAPVRTAAVFTMKRVGDRDYVKALYRTLVLAEFQAMSKGILSLYRSQLHGGLRGQSQLEVFCRFTKVFDYRNRNHATFRVSDQAAMLQEVREYMDAQGVTGNPRRRNAPRERREQLPPTLGFPA